MKTILRSFRHCAITLLLTAASVSASASPSAPVTGVEFLTLPTAQNTDAGQKVEVIEFFAYYCPHCNALQTQLSAWLKKQAPNIVHKRVHIGQGPSANSQQRLYFTLESMGLVEKFQSRVFDAIHVARLSLNRDEQIFDWIDKQGIERQKFIDTFRSFGVQAKVRRANELMIAYHVDQWPMLAIDGRFTTNPTQATEGVTPQPPEPQMQQAALQVMDYLVARSMADKKKP